MEIESNLEKGVKKARHIGMVLGATAMTTIGNSIVYLSQDYSDIPSSLGYVGVTLASLIVGSLCGGDIGVDYAVLKMEKNDQGSEEFRSKMSWKYNSASGAEFM